MLYITFLDYTFGIWFYWYLVLLMFRFMDWEDFQKKNISFMVSVALGGKFLKKDNLQNQECHFLKIACYPILIPDSESK